MIKTYDELMIFLQNLRSGDYQRDNYDKFLHKVKFDFNIPSIHIAGSNGKGSTGTLLNNIYINAGYKVGYYQSPYFIYPSETILVNNKGIDISFFDEIISKYQKEIKKYNLSSFEVETFVAFKYFEANKCDICIIECGMGGETDATNVFTPILSIITSISLEHTSFLGSTISEIAQEKAGIIKDNVPVLLGKMSEEAVLVIGDIAKDMDAKLYQSDDYFNETIVDGGYQFDIKDYPHLYISSLATYSIRNAVLAINATNIIKDQFNVSEENIKDALKSFKLKGRMSVINNKPLIIVDGAHNPEGSRLLKESLEKYSNKKIHIIFASFKDKNIDSMLSELGVISNDIILTTFPNPRSRVEEHYFLYLGDYQYENDCFKAIKDKATAYPDDLILVTGSLAFAGYVINNMNKIRLEEASHDISDSKKE